MKIFLDTAGNLVELSFTGHSFKEQVKHVLVICQSSDGWLLTHHKNRGLEFPGGKIEMGEAPEEAARREVYEETGAILTNLIPIGEYRVLDPKGAFVKGIFWGQVEQMDSKNSYYETNGPRIIRGDILKLRFADEYSFIMKDKVVEECIYKIRQIQGKKNMGIYS